MFVSREHRFAFAYFFLLCYLDFKRFSDHLLSISSPLVGQNKPLGNIEWPCRDDKWIKMCIMLLQWESTKNRPECKILVRFWSAKECTKTVRLEPYRHFRISFFFLASWTKEMKKSQAIHAWKKFLSKKTLVERSSWKYALVDRNHPKSIELIHFHFIK